MTGTGACIFAAFEREDQARAVADRTPERWKAFVARGLNRNPAAVECYPEDIGGI